MFSLSQLLGDRTRKDKLLDAQKEGKKRLKSIGRVKIDSSAFLKIFAKEWYSSIWSVSKYPQYTFTLS